MISRRQFMAITCALTLGLGCKKENKQPTSQKLVLGPVSDFKDPITELPIFRLLIENLGTPQQPKLRALKLVCTHQDCGLSVRPDLKEIHCPCHGSKFSLSGTVLTGPAKKNLNWHPLTIEKNQLVIDMGSFVAPDHVVLVQG